MAQYGYGGRANPFDQRNAAPQQGGYAAQPYGQQPQYADRQYATQTMGRDDYTGSNLEMEPLTGTSDKFPNQSQSAPKNPIFEEIGAIKKKIQDMDSDSGELSAFKTLQQKSLNNPDPSASNEQLDKKSNKIMADYRNLVERIRHLKSNPQIYKNQNYNKPISTIDSQLKNAMKTFEDMDTEFANKLREQMARQYRIVRPEASDAEVREAVGNQTNQQVFSQTLMQSNRHGQAQSAMSAVRSRHEEIKKIEDQMVDLGKLFTDLNTLVELQEAPVANIEMKGEEVVENMDKGNEQIGTAIKSARNARKWKWWCLGIVVLIIAIIVIVVLIYKFVIQNNNNSSKSTSKRFVLPSLERRAISAPTEERSEIPGLKWTRENTLAPVEERWVVDKLEWSPPSKKERRFQA
ncbi:Protein SSO2 [Lachnellula hyalina]|uniref:Protein SSO2 n=1 Tax=Lachnellula hyalina TaxID=1316788 RepID=A0A8H8TVK3_9HELO|nr:Protein SSO2 [Lachnellula hyalina]TVY23457.1 Protein SSO2 [Lachnellula hyalina]